MTGKDVVCVVNSQRLFCSQNLYQMLVLKISGITNSNNMQIFTPAFLLQIYLFDYYLVWRIKLMIIRY